MKIENIGEYVSKQYFDKFKIFNFLITSFVFIKKKSK